MNTVLLKQKKSFTSYIKEKYMNEILSEFRQSQKPNGIKIPKNYKDIVFNIKSENSLVNELLKDQEQKTNGLYVDDIMKIMNDDIKTINIPPYYNVNTLKEMVYNIIDALDGSLYGIILTSDVIEPVCVTNFLSFETAFKKPNVFNKMHIYTIEDEYSNGCFDERIKERLIDCYALTKENSDINICKKKTIAETEAEWFKLSHTALAKMAFFDCETNEKTYFYSLVYHDILANGYMLPYYSASLIKREPNSSNGYDLFDCVSPNISSNNSVCTGSLKNYEDNGLASLKKCNLLSPYRKHIFSDNWRDLSKTNIELVKAILKKDLKEFKNDN